MESVGAATFVTCQVNTNVQRWIEMASHSGSYRRVGRPLRSRSAPPLARTGLTGGSLRWIDTGEATAPTGRPAVSSGDESSAEGRCGFRVWHSGKGSVVFGLFCRLVPSLSSVNFQVQQLQEHVPAARPDVEGVEFKKKDYANRGLWHCMDVNSNRETCDWSHCRLRATLREWLCSNNDHNCSDFACPKVQAW